MRSSVLSHNLSSGIKTNRTIMNFAVILAIFNIFVVSSCEDIEAYHFHTYYFQDNSGAKASAVQFRNRVIEQVSNGMGLKDCAVNRLNIAPIGPHPIGSFETCCNRTSLASAISWFMQNRSPANSVLLHPLTKSEVIDHTTRAFWLGQKMPLDTSKLDSSLHDTPICPTTYS